MRGNKTCGTCEWHTAGSPSGRWMCTSPNSHYFTEWRNREDSCDAWEKRKIRWSLFMKGSGFRERQRLDAEQG